MESYTGCGVESNVYCKYLLINSAMQPKHLFPEHLKKSFTGKATSVFEETFIQMVIGLAPHLLPYISRSDAPYAGSEYLGDYLLMLPPGGRFIGICIELQGGVAQGSNSKNGRKGARTGHTSIKGLRRDYDKAFVCQNNGYMFYPVANFEADLILLIKRLDAEFMRLKRQEAIAKSKSKVVA